jgi:hypothetical protein
LEISRFLARARFRHFARESRPTPPLGSLRTLQPAHTFGLATSRFLQALLFRLFRRCAWRGLLLGRLLRGSSLPHLFLRGFCFPARSLLRSRRLLAGFLLGSHSRSLAPDAFTGQRQAGHSVGR